MFVVAVSARSDDLGQDSTARSFGELEVRPGDEEMIAGQTEPAKVFDRASAMHRVCDDEEFFFEIIDMFLELCPERIEQIRDAVARGDSQTLQHAAHAMKGSAGNFSASAAVQASLHLETLARSGDMAAAPEALQVFEDEIERLRTALSEEKERKTCG